MDILDIYSANDDTADQLQKIEDLLNEERTRLKNARFGTRANNNDVVAEGDALLEEEENVNTEEPIARFE